MKIKTKKYLAYWSGKDYIWSLRGGPIIWDNIHKHPLVSKLCCAIGRHDFVVESIEKNNRVILYCFYCEQKNGQNL